MNRVYRRIHENMMQYFELYMRAGLAKAASEYFALKPAAPPPLDLSMKGNFVNGFSRCAIE